ncbi:MAG: VWA domain-containing protein [Bacilli bacterium]|nr:VWA domain-containing protein [Bacilli bacterium]
MENTSKKTFLLFICFSFVVIFFIGFIIRAGKGAIDYVLSDSFKILSSTENKDIEPLITDYFKGKGIKVQIDYAGTIEIMDKLNNNENYDAIWASNSIWLYMLDNSYKIVDSKSTFINPIVFGIKKSVAEKLGFTSGEVYTRDILDAIKDDKLKFVMTSATQTNTGASAYLGFLQTLSGNPEVLTMEHLENENLVSDVTDLLNGVTRTSGSDEFLEDVLLKGNYDAAVSYESSFINLNQTLVKKGKEPYYIVYPVDGVTISDSPLAFVKNENEEKEDVFLDFQKYILSKDVQKKLEKYGRRTWYGGVSENASSVFNKDWGIDTSKYISPIKYPSSKIIKEALVLYQTEFRKPTHTVFCLDYSGSMDGDGNTQLVNAMDYILTIEKASKNMVQFSKKDKITVIAFDNEILSKFDTSDGSDTVSMIDKIKNLDVRGSTNLYKPLANALNILNKEDINKYNLSIILMTDGEGNTGSFYDFSKVYDKVKKDIPVYAIMFGSARESQLVQIANYSNGKVFDGRNNLLSAFKEVRGYN